MNSISNILFMSFLIILIHFTFRFLSNSFISKITSKISVFKKVRDFINKQQRIIIIKKLEFKSCVIDGRDIGSVVFKNAKIKLYIETEEKIRAKRRYKQLIDMGEKSIYAKILKEIKLRDQKDKSRKNSPNVLQIRPLFILLPYIPSSCRRVGI